MSSLADALIDHLFRHRPLASPERLYVALYTEAGDEVSRAGTGYSRAEILTGPDAFTAPFEDRTRNAAPVTFSTPSGDWGRVAAFAMFTARSGGLELFPATRLPQPKNVNAGDPAPQFGIGDLVATVRVETR